MGYVIGTVVCVGLGFLGIFALFAIFAYNRLVALREKTRTAWAQIDVMLKRRYDLIPNLVETVRGYASHERETLERVIQARNNAVTATSQGAAAVSAAEGQLAGALRQLFAVAEAYPNLKADSGFLQLQSELANTENAIAGERQTYNNSVREYNTAIMSFPSNLIAGPFGFATQTFFEVQDQAQRDAPKVQF